MTSVSVTAIFRLETLEFDGDALAAVVERPLLGVLRSLQHLYRKRGLVVPRATGYRFAHALFQDVIYEDLAPALRRAPADWPIRLPPYSISMPASRS